MRRYDVNAKWVDPFEQHEERRTASRFSVRDLTLSLAVEDAVGNGQLVGPGLVKNISHSGAYIVTKHSLSPSQRVSLAIPASTCPAHMCLPEIFFGDAKVLRVEPKGEKQRGVALRFREAFSQSMEFALFIDTLQGVASIMSSPN